MHQIENCQYEFEITTLWVKIQFTITLFFALLESEATKPLPENGRGNLMPKSQILELRQE